MGKFMLWFGGIVLFIVVVTILFQFFLNAKKIKHKKQYFAQLHQQLQVGRKVVLVDGVSGTLTRVGKDTVELKTKSGKVMQISRFAISEIIEQ